ATAMVAATAVTTTRSKTAKTFAKPTHRRRSDEFMDTPFALLEPCRMTKPSRDRMGRQARPPPCSSRESGRAIAASRPRPVARETAEGARRLAANRAARIAAPDQAAELFAWRAGAPRLRIDRSAPGTTNPDRPLCEAQRAAERQTMTGPRYPAPL